MLWLWVLGALLALFILFCMTRLGVRVTLGETVSASVTFGFLRIQAAPSRKPKKKKKPTPEKKQKEPKDLKKTLEKIPRPTKADLSMAFKMLWPPAKRALRRTRNGLRISPLTLRLTIAGQNDPAGAAELYGMANAVLWTVMPALQELLFIPDPSIHIALDCGAEKTQARGDLGVSIRIGTLLALGFGMAIPTLRWLLKFMKAHKKTAGQTQPAAA